MASGGERASITEPTRSAVATVAGVGTSAGKQEYEYGYQRRDHDGHANDLQYDRSYPRLDHRPDKMAAGNESDDAESHVLTAGNVTLAVSTADVITIPAVAPTARYTGSRGTCTRASASPAR